MTKINLTELERLAGEAKLGPGEVEEDRKPWAYAAFLEAADPATILALCKALREAAKGLDRIMRHRGMTQLSECCVHKNCSPLYDEGEVIASCKWQAGVSHGFDESAEEAEQALTAIRAAVEI